MAAARCIHGDGLPLRISWSPRKLTTAFHALRGALNGALQKGTESMARCPPAPGTTPSDGQRVPSMIRPFFVQDDGFQGV